MEIFDPLTSSSGQPRADDAPVLVVVVNNELDMRRVCDEGWYRVPLARLPRRVAAEYLAFYQTGSFPPGERWCIRWVAPVRAYHILTRAELIPDEPGHPRAHALYYRIDLDTPRPLSQPIPSRRLRRITFIATTLARLEAAQEINDLWIKSSAQERLWQAIKQAGVAAERQYPLAGDDEEDGGVADFAVPCQDGGGRALIITDEPRLDGGVSEPRYPAYAPAGWRLCFATRAELAAIPEEWVATLAGLLTP